jgi:hypothetical protein
MLKSDGVKLAVIALAVAGSVAVRAVSYTAVIKAIVQRKSLGTTIIAPGKINNRASGVRKNGK